MSGQQRFTKSAVENSNHKERRRGVPLPAVSIPVVPPSNPEPLWTREEAAAYLRVQPATIYQLTRRRRRIPLPYLPCGKFMRFRKSEIDRWLEQSRQEQVA